MSVSKPSVCLWKRVISTNWKNKFLIHNIIWQKSAFCLRLLVFLETSLRFGIGGPRFFPRVAATMISKRFVELGIIVFTLECYRKYEVKKIRILSLLFKHLVKGPWRTGEWNRKYLGNRLWISLLIRAAVLYQTLLSQTQTKPYCSKFPWDLR